jgi:hypothetical protein
MADALDTLPLNDSQWIPLQVTGFDDRGDRFRQVAWTEILDASHARLHHLFCVRQTGVRLVISLGDALVPCRVDDVGDEADGTEGVVEITALSFGFMGAERKPEDGAPKTHLRRFTRYQMALPARLVTAGGSALNVQVTTLSEGGCFLRSLAIELGARFDLVLYSPAGQIDCRCEVRSQVMEGSRMMGTGVAFVAMPGDRHERLRELLRSLGTQSVA